jgi:hypothetical protein
MRSPSTKNNPDRYKANYKEALLEALLVAGTVKEINSWDFSNRGLVVTGGFQPHQGHRCPKFPLVGC